MRAFDPVFMAKRRRQLGKTQRRLAKEVGVSQVSISSLESGRKSPRSATLAKLAHALECDMNLFFKEGSK